VTVVLDSRDDFTLEAFRRVCWDGESVEVGERGQAAMAAARASFMALLERDRNAFVYGVTSGGGEGARVPVPPEEQRARSQQPAFNMGSSAFGDPYPERVARGMVFARLTNFVSGHAKVRSVLAGRVAAMLDGPLPSVPSRGTTWAGETMPLAELFWHLRGPELEEAEPMALINGSPVSAALAADAALRARRRLALADQVFALAIEGMNAPLEAYDPALKGFWGDPYESEALDAIGALLEGTATEGRREFQAPVSWRILPRALGQAHRAVALLEKAATTSLRSITDNPVYVLPDDEHPLGRVFSTGGYHNGMAAPAIDLVAQSWADLAGLCDRQATKLLCGDVSLLPHRLTHGGYATGFDRVLVQWAEEARNAAQPTFIPMSEGGGSPQDDTPCPTHLAYGKEERVAECLDACLAGLAITASQALWVTEREPAPPLRALLAEVRERFAPVDSLRDQGAEAELVWRRFREKAVS
jgi:histidine ammonia-lyase